MVGAWLPLQLCPFKSDLEHALGQGDRGLDALR